MVKIRLVFKNIVTYTAWTLIVINFSLVGSLLALMPKSRRYKSKMFYFLSYMTGKLMLKASFVKINITGLHNLQSSFIQPAIVAANHSSSMDIPVIASLVGSCPHTWVSKASLGKIPLFGFALKRFNVLVNRTDSIRAAKTITDSLDISGKNKTHILIFPEGRRYEDNKIHRFYPGFALLAKQLQRPVIPVLIFGLNKVYPRHSKLIFSDATNINVVIGEPMFYNTQEEDAQTFTQRVQDWFKNEIEKKGE
jgi:1-acyl-sn-glycerol-3-phosphate acyltransferase